MKCELVKIDELCGIKTTIYSIIINDDDLSLFDYFVEENENLHKSEIKSILERLYVIGNTTGAQEHYFKLKEGTPGDGVCALYDMPDKKLRLYCIRYGTTIIVLGGGGIKPSNIRALQEDEKLTHENYLLRAISKKITEKITDRDITFSLDLMELEGELEFHIEI